MRLSRAIFFLSVFLFPALSFAGGTTTVYNPFTGKLDYVGPGNGLKIGDIYYLYKDGTSNVYWTFDGTSSCFYVNSAQQFCFPGGSIGNFLLLETGSFLLLETGTKLTLE